MTNAGWTAQDTLASGHMKRGIALLRGGTSDDLAKAIDCFDQAIDLRRQLPIEENAGFRYSLAGSWINRGDAMAKLNGEEHIMAAIDSYAKAIDLLERAPERDESGLFVQRLAIAWLNRGFAWERLDGVFAAEEAIRSYECAIAVLDASPYLSRIPHRVVCASAWANLARARLRFVTGGGCPEACSAAERAIALVVECDAEDSTAAEVGLKARLIKCEVTAADFHARTHPPDAEDICRLTDAVEEALEFARRWDSLPETPFRVLAEQIFRLGALAYAEYQPQFLGEYLLEQLTGRHATTLSRSGRAWCEIAQDSLRRARRRVVGFDFAWLARAGSARRLELLREIDDVSEKIRERRGPAEA